MNALVVLGLVVLGLLGGALAQPNVDEGAQMWTNPCLHYKCPGDRECVTVANDLLQLPVPHCVEKEQQPDDDDDEGCWRRDVGVSIVSCRTQKQWQAIATSTCGFNTGASVEVRHSCHRRDSSSPSIFLQATISCCLLPVSSKTPPNRTETTPTSPTYDIVSSSLDNNNAQDYDEDDEENDDDHRVGVVVIVTLGSLVVVSVIVTGLIKYLFDQRRKRLTSSSLLQPLLQS
ncbi:hypothetical protein GBAR_LOCUS911 [Geodia barretti]|uniref:Uncharacterized protein n=1 Tax=Geodia barretti TaxID=519541 RepID=A0AA35QV32_GEOBA|nr:hypothetical protein GBAR_LOCUS911 [Geodia barretti]